MITAKIIAHSKSPEDKEIISLQLHYPKFIHGEFMTHRVFSRNASSSRAIPFDKLVDDIEYNMAMPVYWGSNKPGMQAGEEIVHIDMAKSNWTSAFGAAKHYAWQLHELGVHKQIVNRLLEPFYNINVLVTSTEWDNFFELRDHPDAQPEIRDLAWKMRAVIKASTSKELDYGEWHLPYIQCAEKGCPTFTQEMLIKMSVARCARVSYLTHEGKDPDYKKDLELYDRLVGSKPIHASPAEHQATPCSERLQGDLQGNFKQWVQYRKMLEKGISL